jgi:hypothetical protein
MRMVIVAVVAVFLMLAPGDVFSQPDLDQATLEVDRDYEQEAEDAINTPPKQPVIKIEGQGENLEGYPGGEGDEEIVPVGKAGGENAEIREK